MSDDTKREAAHTPGPWSVDEDQRPGMSWNRHIYGPDGNAVCFMAHSDGKDVARDEANAALIARAPNLAAEVERLQTKREELRKSVAAIVGADEATWPDHGNVELAVAAHVAILQKAVEQKTSEVDRLREELERERGRVEDLCAENIDFRKTLEAEFGSHWEDVHDAVHRVEHKRRESKHTPETALALARVAIFDRGIGWQADTTATLKALAAEVERLRERTEGLQAANNELADLLRRTAVALRGPEPEGRRWGWVNLPDLTAAERRKVEALREPTDAMVDAYLKANDAYWAEVDSLVSTVGVWRNGTPREATMVSLRAALAPTEGGA